MKLLSIIILNYKTPEITIECISSLQKLYCQELTSNKFEIIIVDNFSNDDSVKLLKDFLREDPQCFTLIENTKNVGFGGGCNLGAKFATGKYLLFLNSDTQVQDYGICKLVKVFDRDEKIGVVGGKLLDRNKVAQKTVGRFPDLLNIFLNLIGVEYKVLVSSPTTIKEVDWVSGGCLMIRKKLFRKIKGFDERIFMYLEDVEICRRVKNAGYKTIFFPFIKVVHETGASSNLSFAIINTYKGYLYYFKKHKSKLEYLFVKKVFFIKAYLYHLLGILLDKNFLKTTYKEVYKVCQ